MQFMTIWTIKPDHMGSARERFQQTGAPPPEGVKMVGRWHDVAGGRGFNIAETDDATAIAKWCQQWADLLDFEIVPVMTDKQLSEVLAT